MAKRNVSLIKQEEPTFITNFKKRVGYKEENNINAKRECEMPEGDSDDEKEDDKPTVVVLRQGDLTAEEAEELKKSSDCNSETSGRIMFRKPMKRNAADEQVTTSDNSSAPTAKLKKENKELSNNLSKSKTVTVSSASSNLLSFDQTEDDDDA